MNINDMSREELQLALICALDDKSKLQEKLNKIGRDLNIDYIDFQFAKKLPDSEKLCGNLRASLDSVFSAIKRQGIEL